MKNNSHSLFLTFGVFLAFLAAQSSHAAKELDAGQFTVVKNQIEHSKGQSKAPAKVSEKIEQNSVIDTGKASFTEMQFNEGSVMRLGSSTRFSFQSKERLIRLEEGSLLIHTPPGNGGISVDGGGVVGSVSGSTVMASRDREGNFSFVVLESKDRGRVTVGGGPQADMVSGQVAVYQKAPNSLRVYELNLDAVIDYSPLFTQFDKPIPSMDKIQTTADNQSTQVLNETKFLVGPKDLGIESQEPANDVLAMLFEKVRDEIVSSKNTLLTDLSTAAGQEIAKGEGNSGKVLTPPGSIADARQEGGKSIADNSNPSSGSSPTPGADTETAAGGEDLGGTDTAAGGDGGGGTGTGGGTSGPVAPVGGGTTANPPRTSTNRTG